MGQIRIYRKIYCINGVTQNYSLFNPSSLSASSYITGSGDTESTTLIEGGLPITNEFTGIYYADLTPELYATDVTYDLVWFIQYTPTAPIKKLTTRFRLNIASKNPTGEISIEILDNNLEIEIL